MDRISHSSTVMVVNLHCQHDWIGDPLGDTPLGVSFRAFPERFNPHGKACPKRGLHHPMG